MCSSDLLLAEVDSWDHPGTHVESNARVNQLWQIVYEMEPSNRVSDAFEFPKTIDFITSLSLVPIEQLTSSRRN